MRFLFVEDDERFFQWLVDSLPGHVCRRVSTIDELLEIDPKQECDAIFVDLKLPGVSETNMLAVVRALASDVPVIIMTGHAMRADLQRLADGFILKETLVESTRPESLLERAIVRARERATPKETISKLFSALGALRHGIPV